MINTPHEHETGGGAGLGCHPIVKDDVVSLFYSCWGFRHGVSLLYCHKTKFTVKDKTTWK